MIEIRTVTATPAWGLAEGTPNSLSAGRASVAFMKQIQDPSYRVIALESEEIVVRQKSVQQDVGFTLHYKEEKQGMLLTLRYALWFYTRHPILKSRVDQDVRLLLETQCKRRRPGLRAEADFYYKGDLADGDSGWWRYSLLFALNVKDRSSIRRAVRLPEGLFEDLIARAIDDTNPPAPFAQLIASVEASVS